MPARKRADEQSKTEVIRLWQVGHTSGEIAAKMMFTRSQVMGIIHRAKKVGLADSKEPAVTPREDRAPPKTVRPKAPPAARQFTFSVNATNNKTKTAPTPMRPEPEFPDDPDYKGPKSILRLENGDCRWVTRPGMFCARPVKSPGGAWCSVHHSIVYVKADRQRMKKLHADVLLHQMKFRF